MMELSQATRNGIDMPLVGFGTYQLSIDQAEFCVKEALKAGFRHIDSAEGYNNEEGTGKGIKAAGVSRDEIFVTTKLFPGYKQWGAPEKTYEQTIETLKNQLKQLQLDYVDLYLIHAPLSELRLEQWNALVALKKSGLTRHIGVSNYNEETIKEILDAGLAQPEANQVEFHPMCAQIDLTRYMQKHAIAPIAYSSLAPLSTWRMEAGQGGEVLAEKKAESQLVIKEVASKLKVSEAKLLLRWGLQHGYCVLTRSTKPERIRENLQVFDFKIPDHDMECLNRLNQNQAFAWAANGLNPMEVAPPIK
ncbi:2,5-diketo-D-gluconic acid reductase A [Candidatus Vecturithrix granuli]|uniref:2,5-diketo-D-gluconic acid reductase A n=1 Tax=Vecturithrix granuli TaxID=1499967 RepID=A0A081BXX0_VECG1|nr:2,5-diketo-D-gluconic acid reductase A [Candidatus Vecturithrix granuli]